MKLPPDVINFLCTRFGAAVTPLLVSFVAGFVAWLGLKVPAIAPYLTPEAITAFMGVIVSLAMSWVNYVTTSRGFKYGIQVQESLRTIGRGFGVEVKLDGVVGPVTAQKAEVLADSVEAERKEMFK